MAVWDIHPRERKCGSNVSPLGAGAGFICYAPATAGELTVPGYVLAALPAGYGELILGAQTADQSFSASGLDAGTVAGHWAQGNERSLGLIPRAETDSNTALFQLKLPNVRYGKSARTAITCKQAVLWKGKAQCRENLVACGAASR